MVCSASATNTPARSRNSVTDTIANLLLLNTFPIWTDQAGQQDGEVATTASMLILILSWLLLMLVSQLGRGRTAKKTVKLRTR
jgi:putative spermidine/putrescine transport system permease protein